MNEIQILMMRITGGAVVIPVAGMTAVVRLTTQVMMHCQRLLAITVVRMKKKSGAGSVTMNMMKKMSVTAVTQRKMNIGIM